MTIVRRLARPLLAAPLISSGVDAARHPGPQAEVAGPILARVSGPLRLPQDPVVVVRAAGAVTATAGVLLALGKLPRLSALAIVVTAPAVQNVKPFWQEKDPELRRTQRADVIRNLGLLGGALLATVDTEGRPGLAWRGKKAGHDAASAVHDATDSTVGSVKSAGRSARKAARKNAKAASKLAHKQSKKAGKAASKARESLPV